MIGIGSRDEFHASLQSVFVKRHEDQAIFDEAFRLFWRSRDLIGKMIAIMSPVAPDTREKAPRRAGEAAVSDALFADRDAARPMRDEPDIEIDARFTASGRELLRRADFAQMSAAEIAGRRRLVGTGIAHG